MKKVIEFIWVEYDSCTVVEEIEELCIQKVLFRSETGDINKDKELCDEYIKNFKE